MAGPFPRQLAGLLRSFFWVLFTLLLSFFFVFSLIVRKASGDAHLPADCGIVFGAAVSGYNQPGPAIVRRVTKAADLYREGSVHRLILTGGKGRGSGQSESEADVMRREILARGVPSDILVLEEQSHSTLENLLNTRNLTSACDSVVGISDGYHLARIELLAFQEGWGWLPTTPTNVHPPMRIELRSYLRETAAYLFYAFHLHTLASWFGETHEGQQDPLSAHGVASKLLT